VLEEVGAVHPQVPAQALDQLGPHFRPLIGPRAEGDAQAVTQVLDVEKGGSTNQPRRSVAPELGGRHVPATLDSRERPAPAGHPVMRYPTRARTFSRPAAR